MGKQDIDWDNLWGGGLDWSGGGEFMSAGAGF